MLRRVASPALIARSQQVVCTRGLHSKESALYKRQEDLKKRILELRQDLDLKPYERDPEVVQFVNDSYARINNSSSLSSLKVDPRQIKDSDEVHDTKQQVVY